ncbi:hypothetical protein EVAR_54739_1 [Eumeta japonica]|uniref:Uncharacterized protein n=1 Tax=Eumeta variegata TaxID=151549 RepID=A0A4C1YV46_EUMVA|nr:hypothetical protein EVAR_54739_1 [Eumeta japonica]
MRSPRHEGLVLVKYQNKCSISMSDYAQSFRRAVVPPSLRRMKEDRDPYSSQRSRESDPDALSGGGGGRRRRRGRGRSLPRQGEPVSADEIALA